MKRLLRLLRLLRNPARNSAASAASLAVLFLVGGWPAVWRAQAQDWPTVPLITHSDYQAVNSDGTSAYDGPIPFRMRGVVLNNTEDWLDPAESYNEIPWNLGGEAEIFVQAVDLDGTPWDPNPGAPSDDFGGTAAWMGQCYGNLGFVGDPGFSYIDQTMAGPGETRPVWYDELDRLGMYRPETPLPGADIVRAGDLVEVRARVNGFNYQGKHNVNEQHKNLPANDFEVVILEKAYGLPEASALRLPTLKDAQDEAIFDHTRQTGGERYQAERVEIQRVRLADASEWGTNSDLVLEDDTGRSLDVHLGLNPTFGNATAPWGYFHVTGILDQMSSSENPNQDGYRLLAMSAADFVHMEGDTNRDWDVDNTDLGTATGSFTGPGGSGKTWADGDSDGDGDVDNTDLGYAFGNFTGPVLPPELAPRAADVLTSSELEMTAGAPDRADLIYDPGTGEVRLDQTEAAGRVLTNFVLGDNEGGLNTGVANWPFSGRYKTDLPFEISQTDPGAEGLPEDVWNLGAVLPAGMDQQELEGFLDQATYVGALGTGMFDLDLVAVPEPGSMALLAAALAAGTAPLLRRRRRRNNP